MYSITSLLAFITADEAESSEGSQLNMSSSFDDLCKCICLFFFTYQSLRTAHASLGVNFKISSNSLNYRGTSWRESLTEFV